MARPFWLEGVRFECQGTGRCCKSRGRYGWIYLTLEDRQRLAALLGMKTGQFTRRHCERTDGLWHLRHPERDCAFLEGARCGVYEARPTQCRTWPFWPENMNARAWPREVASFCEGAGKGRLYSAAEIQGLMAQARRIHDG